MEELLKALYRRSEELDVNCVEAGALRGLQSAYLSMCALGLLCPWVLEGVTDMETVHARVRVVGRRLETLACDGSLPLAERLSYAADLLDSYMTWTDAEFVERGLDIAWALLYSGEERMTLPCRTAGMCRLLCHCYYFTGDEACLCLVRELAVEEALGRSDVWNDRELLEWSEALRLYADVAGDAAFPGVEQEEKLQRLCEKARQVENAILDAAKPDGNVDDLEEFSRLFAIVAERVLDDCVAEGNRWFQTC